MVKKENLTVGKFIFTNEGVCRKMRPYSTEPCPVEILNGDAFYHTVHDLIRHRLDHCYRELEANFEKASYVSDELVVWEGGYFNAPLYKTMEMWLESGSTNVPRIIAQQSLRQMFEEQNFSDKDLFRYLTEVILIGE